MDTSVRPGEVLLGKYRVERVLGKGGMGLVVAARHLSLGELFAIKFLSTSTIENAEVIERFEREARAAARLRGEHVARVHDVGRMENGAPYMIMEYLDGSDLHALVRRRGPLPVEEAVAYVLQACDGIAEAHAAGIVHRDLKPANLFLIRRPNGSPCVKVLDFGVARQTGVEEVALTATGVMLGSPMYMAPEQIARSKSVDARSDIWAMGVVLYELLTARGPFQGQTVLELVAAILQEEPPRPSELRPDLPAALEAVILRCLRKRSEERFQSMGELAAALDEASRPAAAAVLAGGTVLLPGPARASAPSAPNLFVQPPAAPSLPMPVAPPMPMPVAPLASAPALARPPFASTPAIQASTNQAWGQTGYVQAAAPRPSGRFAVAIGAVAALVLLGGGGWFVLGRSSGPTPAADVPAASAAPVETAAPAPPPRETAPIAAIAAPEQAPAPSSAPSASAAPAAPPVKVQASRPSPPTKPHRPSLW
ncbi:serine/threonine-protein kinase [Polyangium spumosum]|nr:serine/threonine-protein kinase [Polyangium spumosum]